MLHKSTCTEIKSAVERVEEIASEMRKASRVEWPARRAMGWKRRLETECGIIGSAIMQAKISPSEVRGVVLLKDVAGYMGQEIGAQETHLEPLFPQWAGRIEEAAKVICRAIMPGPKTMRTLGKSSKEQAAISAE
ncbi:MAG TPA: hypothetical protein VMV50_03340 [Candidatus Paceibacterota bacterium]|nr:hypothetical protein [Candidatus Paceibacterota bacterium]